MFYWEREVSVPRAVPCAPGSSRSKEEKRLIIAGVSQAPGHHPSWLPEDSWSSRQSGQLGCSSFCKEKIIQVTEMPFRLPLRSHLPSTLGASMDFLTGSENSCLFRSWPHISSYQIGTVSALFCCPASSPPNSTTESHAHCKYHNPTMSI